MLEPLEGETSHLWHSLVESLSRIPKEPVTDHKSLVWICDFARGHGPLTTCPNQKKERNPLSVKPTRLNSLCGRPYVGRPLFDTAKRITSQSVLLIIGIADIFAITHRGIRGPREGS